MARIPAESDLPQEVLEEIFSWLPPESLIRFKCVSKTWYVLINFLLKNPAFVNKHLHNIDKKILSSTSLLVCYDRELYRRRHPKLDWESLRRKLLKSVTIFHNDNDSDHINYVTEDLDLPNIPSVINVSQCNGIICAAHCSTIILYNPAIKECRTLPKLGPPYGQLRAPLGLGFGFDNRANDYKVVSFGIFRSLTEPIEYKTKALVYCMATDSWRDVGASLEFECLPYVEKEVFHKGVFYWLIWAVENIILCFNLFDEVFHRIPLPNDLIVERVQHNVKLAIWDDSVTLFCCPAVKAASKSIEVWVMNDSPCGVKGFWIKKLTIGPLVDIAIPLTFCKNDEFLMEATDRGLISYNLRTQMLRKLNFNLEVERARRWDFSYVKSLVSVMDGSLSCK